MVQLFVKSRNLLPLMAFAALAGCGGGGGSGDAGNDQSPPEPPTTAPTPTSDVSGVIAIEARTRIDSDTADDFQIGAAQSNNATPQPLPSPALAGGYLSSVGGSYVVSQTPGDAVYYFFTDEIDRYQLALTENQTVNVQAFPVVEGPSTPGNPLGQVTLQLPDEPAIDSKPIPVSGAASVSPKQGAATATYILSLESAQDSGPFRYVISVTANDAEASTTFSYSQPDFMPDEAIVTMNPGRDISAKAMVSALSAGQAEAMGHGTWHLKRSGAAPVALMSSAQKTNAQKETLAWIKKLRASPDVRTAEPNYLVHGFAVNSGDDPLFQRQWDYPLISLPTAWQALDKPGQGVRVAVLDTGVFSTDPSSGGSWHPDLDNGSSNGNNIEILPTADFVSASQDNDGNPGRDGNPADPGDGGSPQTTSFHGTHVAGTIAALDNTSGGVGVAPFATLLPVRVLGKGEEGTATDLIDAINAMASLPPATRPDIINLSLGGLGPVDALKNAIQRAVDKNIIVVAAAGNQGTSDKVYPASFDNVVAVGAVDAGRRRAGYSSFGSWLQLVAPGGDASRDGNNDGQADIIISPWGTIDNGNYEPVYAGLQGTSMAAPHVSGVIALMKERYKERDEELNLGQFLGFLQQGDLTDDVGNSNEYGYGLINAVKAVGAATNGTLGNFLVPTPGSFQFEPPFTPAEITLQSFGDNAIDPDSISVTPTPDWLEVTRPGALTLSARIVEAEKAKAEQASVTINYTNDSGPQTLKIPVNVQSGDAPESRNAGRHFVLLVSTDELEKTVFQMPVEPRNGQYRFAFDDVPNGEYFVVAGSDLDNNGYICEAGEACAEYPTNGFPQPVTKGDDAIQGLQLTTSFQRPALESQSLPRTGFRGYRLLDHDGAGSRISDNSKSVAP